MPTETDALHAGGGVAVFAYIEPETFNCVSAETRAQFPEDARTFEVPVVLADDYATLRQRYTELESQLRGLVGAGEDAARLLAELEEYKRHAEMFQQLVIGEGAWERFHALQLRTEAAEANEARYLWLCADENASIRLNRLPASGEGWPATLTEAIDAAIAARDTGRDSDG